MRRFSSSSTATATVRLSEISGQLLLQKPQKKKLLLLAVSSSIDGSKQQLRQERLFYSKFMKMTSA